MFDTIHVISPKRWGIYYGQDKVSGRNRIEHDLGKVTIQNHDNSMLISQPDKSISYSPPELGKTVEVFFFFHEPKEIHSKILSKKKRALLVVDGNLDNTKIDLVLSLVKKYVEKVHIYKLEYGEKNLNRVRQIWEAMIQFHPDIAVALGGGTTCDVLGFAASCYHRGLDHIFFPTTLLSMVDACIGGKTGIDFGGVKNSVGQIHYALESYCIFPFLESLNYEELISGFSEVVKVGMLFDENLIGQIEKLPKRFTFSKDWFSVVGRGAELKAGMSENPFYQRSKLLYGHNIGHGLEISNHAHQRHGDCVSIGMNFELAIGVVIGEVDKAIWERQQRILERFKLPFKIPKRTNFEKIKSKMRKYKLYKEGRYLFILPKKPGEIIESNKGYYVELSDEQLDHSYMEAKKLISQ